MPLLDIGNRVQHQLELTDRFGLVLLQLIQIDMLEQDGERIADPAQLAAIAASVDQHLPLDRTALDFRRIVVSDRRLAGRRRDPPACSPLWQGNFPLFSLFRRSQVVDARISSGKADSGRPVRATGGGRDRKRSRPSRSLRRSGGDGRLPRAVGQDLDALDRASQACDAVLRLLDSAEPNQPAYNLLCRELQLLDTDPGAAGRAHALAFRIKLLLAAGFAPELAACASCGDHEHLGAFSASAGGVP